MSTTEKKLRSLILGAALLAALADPEKLKKVAQDAINVVGEQEKSLDDAFETITALEAEAAKLKKEDKNYRPEVKLKSGIYRVVHGVNLGEGKGISEPEDIAKDVKLAESLLAGGSSALVKVG